MVNAIKILRYLTHTGAPERAADIARHLSINQSTCFNILRTLVAHAGRTLTHQQIFEAVWGAAAGSPQQYLRVHITNLRRKIEAHADRPELIVTEPGVGYRAELPG